MVPVALLAELEELDDELVRSPEELGDVGAPSPAAVSDLGLLFLEIIEINFYFLY